MTDDELKQKQAAILDQIRTAAAAMRQTLNEEPTDWCLYHYFRSKGEAATTAAETMDCTPEQTLNAYMEGRHPCLKF